MNRKQLSLMPNPAIYTVSQLNRETRLLLSQHFQTLQVEGEISNLSTPASGHIYFSLKDTNAQVRCAMFRSQLRRVKFKPENGLQVVLTAQVGLYEPRGDYQLLVESIQEAGDGALQRAFDELKLKLSREGLFDEQRKQSLPPLPSQLGIISSPSGAAVHDILSVISRRFPALPVVLYPTAVQGEAAQFEIAKAIKLANQRKECDVLLVSRGGGSLEDLWAFNEEIVARTIFESQIPVITGIGHEIDFTIADFVADYRAPTPSAAAETITPDQTEWLNRFMQLEKRLLQQLNKALSQNKQQLLWLSKRLQQLHPGKQLQNHFQRLDELENRLLRAVQHNIQQSKIALNNLNIKLWQHHPASKIKQYQIQHRYLSQRLIAAQQRQLELKQHQFLKCSQTLHAVSPLATLNRGYAIVTEVDTNTVIHNSKTLEQGQHIKTRLGKGSVVSQIEEIEHEA